MTRKGGRLAQKKSASQLPGLVRASGRVTEASSLAGSSLSKAKARSLADMTTSMGTTSAVTATLWLCRSFTE